MELEHPHYGVVRMPGVSLEMSATPAVAPRLATTVPVDEIPPHRPGSAPDAHVPDEPPLAGVRVLDLGVVIAGA